MKRNLKSLKRLGMFRKKIKKIKGFKRFRFKRMKLINRKILLSDLNSKINFTRKHNFLRNTISKGRNSTFKKSYFYLLRKFIENSNSIEKDYVLKNKSDLLSNLSSISLQNYFVTKKKNLKLVNFFRRVNS